MYIFDLQHMEMYAEKQNKSLKLGFCDFVSSHT